MIGVRWSGDNSFGAVVGGHQSGDLLVVLARLVTKGGWRGDRIRWSNWKLEVDKMVIRGEHSVG